MSLVDNLQSYLVDTKQLDPLAARQARVLCRSIVHEEARERARVIVLLNLAALGKGSPRASRKSLLAPMQNPVIRLYADMYRSEHGTDAPWTALGENQGWVDTLQSVVDGFFSNPQKTVPFAGGEPRQPGETWPLLVVNDLHSGFSRQWLAAAQLEMHVNQRLSEPSEPAPERAGDALHEVFVVRSILPPGQSFHYRQVAAAALALRTRFLILSGGPGTGKSSVILQILRTLVRVFPEISPDRIVLCAPTGRAKARLGESLVAGLDTLAQDRETDDEGLRNVHTSTLHGLLGMRPNGTFRHGHGNPLPSQVVVVDEASMVDVHLFAALMDALDRNCRLILVGDMHQLPSVDAGAVLGDLTERFAAIPGLAALSPDMEFWIDTVAGETGGETDRAVEGTRSAMDEKTKLDAGLLTDHVVLLSKSYRSATAILDLARLINAGDSNAVQDLLNAHREPPVVSLDTRPGMAMVKEWLLNRFDSCALDLIRSFDHVAIRGDEDGAVLANTIASIKQFLFGSVILTLAHGGTLGRVAINVLAEKEIRSRLKQHQAGRFFHGMPVILCLNHHNLDLYNGDMGMVVRTKDRGLKVCFPRGNGCLLPAVEQLTDLEPAFALTVHKAQGSEFDRALVVLPEQSSPLLNRQIIYTAVTRARHAVTILSDRSVLAKAVNAFVRRDGGIVIG